MSIETTQHKKQIHRPLRTWPLLSCALLFLAFLAACGYDYDALQGIGRSPGFRDGNKDNARFFYPYGLDVDPLGNLFVADYGNDTIRLYQPKEGKVSDVGKQGKILSHPTDLAVWSRSTTPPENWVFVTDTAAHQIHLFQLKGSSFEQREDLQFAGTGVAGLLDGPADIAQFRQPSGLALSAPKPDDPRYQGEPSDDLRPVLFVADTQNHVIRSITHITNKSCQRPLSKDSPITGYCVHTIAGNRKCGQVDTPIRHFDGCIETKADEPPGTWLPADKTAFHQPGGLAVGPCGALYLSDTHNHRIRKIRYICTKDSPEPYSPSCYQVKTIAGSWEEKSLPTDTHSTDLDDRTPSKGLLDGPGLQAKFAYPQGLTVTKQGIVYVADLNNHSIRRLVPEGTFSCDKEPTYRVETMKTEQKNIATPLVLRLPFDVALSPDQKTMYVTLSLPQRHMIAIIQNYEELFQ